MLPQNNVFALLLLLLLFVGGGGGEGSAQFGVLQISSCDFEKGLRVKKETTNYEGVA